MGYEFGRVMFGEAARRLQEARGSRGSYARREASEFANDELGLQEAEFLQMRDSFYLASVTEDGWPYVQHRGGRPGFLKVLDAKTLAFADYAGNKQYITAGNLETNDRVELFAMDYPEQARLKVIGHARVVEAGLDAALESQGGGRRRAFTHRAGGGDRGGCLRLELLATHCSEMDA